MPAGPKSERSVQPSLHGAVHALTACVAAGRANVLVAERQVGTVFAAAMSPLAELEPDCTALGEGGEVPTEVVVVVVAAAAAADASFGHNAHAVHSVAAEVVVVVVAAAVAGRAFPPHHLPQRKS